MSGTMITSIDEAQQFVEGVVTDSCVDIDGITRDGALAIIEIDISEVERDSDSVMAIEGDVTSVFTGEDEGSYDDAFMFQGEDDAGNAVMIAGWHNKGEYCDDENDARLSGIMIVTPAGDEKEVARAREMVVTRFQDYIDTSVMKMLRDAADLMKHASPRLGGKIYDDAAAMEAVRAIALAGTR